jgi:uncharacterized damage-inducible protein DinB
MEDFIAELEATTKELLDTLSRFTQEQLNTLPFEGSWTAAQVAEHLLKSKARIPQLLTGNSRPTTERPPDEKTEVIKAIFLDFSTKLKSPDFIIPSDEIKEKQALLSALQSNSEEIRSVIHTADLSRTFTDHPFPQLGELTGWEWICFMVCHSKRHIRQLKNIYTTITNRQFAPHLNEN